MTTEDSLYKMGLIHVVMFIVLGLSYSAIFIYSVVTGFKISENMIMMGQASAGLWILGAIYLLHCHFTASEDDTNE